MIVEIADFTIDDAQRDAFKHAIANGVETVLSKAKGYLGHKILACHETPGRFVLIVEWATLEDHTKGFRESPDFANWRAIIGPFFKQPPHVEHFVVTHQS